MLIKMLLKSITLAVIMMSTSAFAGITETEQVNLRPQFDAIVNLGDTYLTNRADADFIPVRNGRVCGLSNFRIAVQGDGARIDDLRVLFANGSIQDVTVRQNFPAGSASRWIDLAGSTRCVTGIYVFGRSNSNTPRQTKIVFQGIQRSNDTPIPVGATSLNNGRDADLINLPRPVCNLKAFQLRVRQDSARIDLVAVQFGNGDIQQIPIRSQFTRGSNSAWKDLNGRNRCIDRIFILGRSNGNTARQAIVEFWALLD